MNESEIEEQIKEFPITKLVNFFSSKFANSNFEYGIDRLGMCRYPLDVDGNRIIEQLPYCPHTLGLYGGSADISETLAVITSNKGDTPDSFYFRFNPDIVDIYSEHFDNSAAENIDVFIKRLKQHLELINHTSSVEPFKKISGADFIVTFSFKFEHVKKEVSRISSIMFSKSDGTFDKYFITNNKLTTQASIRKMDMEFFNRYYKNKLAEAIPDVSLDQLRELIDLSNWSDNLKSLVKMTHYC